MALHTNHAAAAAAATTAGGTDAVTAAADLCAHVRIQPALRNAALTLVGSDLYKKVKPPGDTSLYT